MVTEIQRTVPVQVAWVLSVDGVCEITSFTVSTGLMNAIAWTLVTFT